MLNILWKGAVILLAAFGGFMLFIFFVTFVLLVYALYKKSNETIVTDKKISINRLIDIKTHIRYRLIGNYEVLVKGELWGGSELIFIRNPAPGILWQAISYGPTDESKITCISNDSYVIQSLNQPSPLKLNEKAFKESEYYGIVEDARKMSAFVREKVAPIIKKARASRK